MLKGWICEICHFARASSSSDTFLRYNFTPEDLTTNRRQLKYFLDNFDEIPYTVVGLCFVCTLEKG